LYRLAALKNQSIALSNLGLCFRYEQNDRVVSAILFRLSLLGGYEAAKLNYSNANLPDERIRIIELLLPLPSDPEPDRAAAAAAFECVCAEHHAAVEYLMVYRSQTQRYRETIQALYALLPQPIAEEIELSLV
jgi:hypothetical protein